MKSSHILSIRVLQLTNTVLDFYRGHSTSTSHGKGEGEDKKVTKMAEELAHAAKKVMPLTQILLCIIFPLTQFFLLHFSHEGLIILQRETRKTHPRAYQCI